MSKQTRKKQEYGRIHDKRLMCCCKCMWIPIGPVTCLEKKSTTGVSVRQGKHLLGCMTCLQTLVAFPCGEAEYCALIREACTSLGMQSHCQDWMIDVSIDVYNDSSASRRVAQRRGIGGRLGHLQTSHLLFQSRVPLRLNVVASEQNPPDTLTKGLPSRKIREWTEGSSRKSLNARGRGSSGQSVEEAKSRRRLLASRWESWCFLDNRTFESLWPRRSERVSEQICTRSPEKDVS